MTDIPDSLTYANRSYRYELVPGLFFSAVLIFVQDEHSGKTRPAEVYGVEEIPADCDNVVRGVDGYYVLCKCGPHTDEREGLYLVTVPYSELRPVSCQCFGFNRWGNCKHCAVFSDLRKRGGL